MLRLDQRLPSSSPVTTTARAATTAVLVAVLLAFTGSQALGHDGLISTEPGDGTVAGAPDAVVLTFSGDQLAVGSTVVVTGLDGQEWADGEPQVAGAVVTQPLQGGLPGGTYEVGWRSVSGDGHPVEGVFRFEVTDADAAGAVAPSATPSSPTPPASTDQPSAASAEPDDEAAPTQSTPEDATATRTSGLAVVTGFAAVALLAVGAVHLVGRRRGGHNPDRTG